MAVTLPTVTLLTAMLLEASKQQIMRSRCWDGNPWIYALSKTATAGSTP